MTNTFTPTARSPSPGPALESCLDIQGSQHQRQGSCMPAASRPVLVNMTIRTSEGDTRPSSIVLRGAGPGVKSLMKMIRSQPQHLHSSERGKLIRIKPSASSFQAVTRLMTDECCLPWLPNALCLHTMLLLTKI